MRSSITKTVLIGLSLAAGSAVAQETVDVDRLRPLQETNEPEQSPAPSPAPRDEQAPAYLGVLLEPLDPAVRAHIPTDLQPLGGVLVRQVEKDSPAEKAGLARYDVIVQIGPTRVQSPLELIDAVKAFNPGDAIDLSIIRGGKQSTLRATAGTRPEGERLAPRIDFPGFGSMFDRLRGQGERQEVIQFETLNVRKLADERMEVEYRYRKPDGTSEHLAFQGTLEEVRQQIQAHQWLDQARKQTLVERLEKGDDGRGLDLQMEEFWPRKRHLDEMLKDAFTIW